MIDGVPADAWAASIVRELEANPDTDADATLLRRTTAFGYYDGNLVGLIERIDEAAGAVMGPAPAAAGASRASGSGRFARKRSCSRAARSSAASPTPTTICPERCSPAPRARTSTRYAVLPGTRAVVFTNNDSAYA